MDNCRFIIGCIVVAVCCCGILSYEVTHCEAYKYVNCFKDWAEVKKSDNQDELCKGLEDLKNCTRPIIAKCSDPSYARQVEVQVNATYARVVCEGCSVHTTVFTVVFLSLIATFASSYDLL